MPNNDISHNKTDHKAKLRIELKSILLAKPLNWYISFCDLVFTVSHRHWRKMWVDYLGWGVGGEGAQRICWPPFKLLGDLVPLPPRSYAYVNLKLQRRIRYFKFEWSCWNDNKYCDKTLDAQVGPHLCIWRESARALTHVWKQIISIICHKEKKQKMIKVVTCDFTSFWTVFRSYQVNDLWLWKAVRNGNATTFTTEIKGHRPSVLDAWIVTLTVVQL